MNHLPHLTDGVLSLDGRHTLTGLPDNWSIKDAPSERSCFLEVRPDGVASYLEIPLGRIAHLDRFVCCHRYSPFWVKPVVGRDESDLPVETLWILADVGHARFVLLVSLLADRNRYSLAGSGSGITLVVETGSAEIPCTAGEGLFVAAGECPYTLMAESAASVAAFFHTGGLRQDKPAPDFVDLFGWCTWDAFYKDVSAEKVISGLRKFHEGGVTPPLLILDDGWQTWRPAAGGEDRLVSLRPNDRFQGDLSSLIAEAKAQWGVRRFLVWHAMMGYWGGICPAALPEYLARTQPKIFGPGILAQNPRWNVTPWVAAISVPSADGIAKFYHDYHRSLAEQGVDGVKVDAQALLEAVAGDTSGRVRSARDYRIALDRSVLQHFDNRLINCMSGTAECAYLATSAVMRSSDDFLPLCPESHGMHLYTNAQVGMWFGQFMHLDWDMFQSSHERGSFHAAARAISGGPVYVSDKPGEHDFSVLKRLVLTDGTILRADFPGRPTVDSLFLAASGSDAPLKIFNRNGECGVIGVFNIHHDPTSDRHTVTGTVSPADVLGLESRSYLGFLHQRNHLWRASESSPEEITLLEGGWEIAAFAPIEHGVAVFGLCEKYNCTASIVSRRWTDTRKIEVVLRDGGKFLAWSDRRPTAILIGTDQAEFTFDETSGRVECQVDRAGATTITLWLP